MARMKDVHKDSGSLLMGRATLRIPRDVVEAIDAECSRRVGSVSRNTWIIEAVMEKLTRHSSVTRPQSDGIGNG
jgi:predicted HicB family RNase H-like nuclease